MRSRVPWLALLLVLAVSGCWLTGNEVKRKIKQYDEPPSTGDTAEP